MTFGAWRNFSISFVLFLSLSLLYFSPFAGLCDLWKTLAMESGKGHKLIQESFAVEKGENIFAASFNNIWRAFSFTFIMLVLYLICRGIHFSMPLLSGTSWSCFQDASLLSQPVIYECFKALCFMLVQFWRENGGGGVESKSAISSAFRFSLFKKMGGKKWKKREENIKQLCERHHKFLDLSA